MTNTSIILTIENVGQGDCRFTAQLGDAQVGTAVNQWAHPVDRQRLEAETQALKREIRRSVERDAPSERLQGHGRLIFDLLFPSPLKRLLREQEGTLGIISEDFDLPWAALHDGSAHLGAKWGIGRLVVGAKAAHTSTKVERTLVIADPSGDLPAAHFEGEALVRLFAGEGGGTCDLRLGPMRKADFLRQFSRYDIVHFAGHAEAGESSDSRGWRFRDGVCVADEISRTSGARAPRLVYANACQSAAVELQAAFVDAGVSHQVCTQVDVPDLAGAEFATVFYRCLHAGQSIGSAFSTATKEAIRQESPVWLAYQLLGDPRAVYFQAKGFRRLPSGSRRGAFIAIRVPQAEGDSVEYVKERGRTRAKLKETIQGFGGRILPGRTAVTRAVFGIPVSFENDAARAAQAALSISEAFPSSLTIVGFGELVVDGVEVDGPLLHRAEALCWGTESGVLALNDARAALRDTVRFGEEIDNAVRIVSLYESDTVHYAPLIGRDEQLGRVARGASACLDEQAARFIFVVGSAGIGKSHLVHVAGARLGASFRRLRGRARAYSEGTPYGPYAEVLRQLMDAVEPPNADTVRSYLKRLNEQAIHSTSPIPISIETLLSDELDTQPVTEYHAEIMALLGDDSHADSIEPGQLSRAFAQVIAAEAAHCPLAVFLSDLHWLPSAGHAIVEELIQTKVGGGFLFVGTARPGVVEAIERWSNRDHVERLDLGPLSRSAAEALIRQTAPESSDNDVQTVLERAEGNPLYLRELALGSRSAEPLPGTIEGVIRARFDRLNHDLKETLQAAALWGRSFRADGTGVLLENPSDLMTRLIALEQGRFIHRSQTENQGSKWRFDHGLLHEVVYQGIPEQTRKTWHSQAAAWLITHTDGSQVGPLLQIARHHQNAQDMRRAAHAWHQCGLRAAQLVMPNEALSALREAVDIDDKHAGALTQEERAASLARLGGLLFAAGDLTGAEENLAQAVDLTDPKDQFSWSQRLFERARVVEGQGHIDLADELVSRAREGIESVLGANVQKLDLELRRYGAWLTYRRGDIPAAATAFKALLAEVPEGESLIMGLAMNGLGVAAYGLGDYSEAYTHFHDALGHFEEAGSQRRSCSAFNNLGMVSAKRGSAREAITWYERALSVHAKAGNRTGLAQTYNNIGTLYGDLNDLPKAEGFFRESVRIREASGHSGLAIGYANLSEVLFKMKHLEDALGYVTQAITLCENGQGPQYLLPDAHRMLAEMQLAKGTIDLSIVSGKRALTLAERASDAARKAAAHRALGQAYSAGNQMDRAEHHLTQSIETLEELDHPFELARAYEAKADYLDAQESGDGEPFRRRAEAVRKGLAL